MPASHLDTLCFFLSFGKRFFWVSPGMPFAPDLYMNCVCVWLFVLRRDRQKLELLQAWRSADMEKSPGEPAGSSLQWGQLLPPPLPWLLPVPPVCLHWCRGVAHCVGLSELLSGRTGLREPKMHRWLWQLPCCLCWRSAGLVCILAPMEDCLRNPKEKKIRVLFLLLCRETEKSLCRSCFLRTGNVHRYWGRVSLESLQLQSSFFLEQKLA